MTTLYEISNNSNNDLYDGIKNLIIGTPGASGFIEYINDTMRPKSKLVTTLLEIQKGITSIETVGITGASSMQIIENNTTPYEIGKIHFLAASIYQKLVTSCLTALGTKWNDVKTIIDDKLKLDASGSGPTYVDHFYVEPLSLAAGDASTNADNILMYQLLQQLIAKDMNPDIDDVLDFLSKIDSSWCVEIDITRATAEYEELKSMPKNKDEIAASWKKLQLILRILMRLKVANIDDIGKQSQVQTLSDNIDNQSKVIELAEASKKIIDEFNSKTANIANEIKKMIDAFNTYPNNFPDGKTRVVYASLDMSEKIKACEDLGLYKLCDDLILIMDLKKKIEAFNLSGVTLEKDVSTYITQIKNNAEQVINAFKTNIKGPSPGNYLDNLEAITIIGIPSFTPKLSNTIRNFKREMN